MTLRLRLTLVFAVATAIVLAGVGWLLYARLASDLSQSLDQALRSRAQDLAALVEHGGALPATTGPLIEHGETFAELLDRGRVVDATRPISTPLVSREPLPRFFDRPHVPGLNEPARLLAVRLADGRVLVVGATGENRAETLRSLRAAFLVGGPLALLLTSLAGYLLAGAALRPIEAMRRRAEEISSSSLDERLPIPASREVARLAETLNEMLARLEEGLLRERRFVADASHELRTPLGLLKTELELALRRERTPEELRHAVESAAHEVDRLERIADDLLLLARSDQGKLPLRLEPTDVGDVLRAVAQRFSARGPVVVAPESGELVVAADRLRLEQALGNLVDNALRHGGGPVELSAQRENGAVELHVRDAGAGFPAAFVAHAFDRFSQADTARGGGSGLGLAIVDTVARAHAGSAHAANRRGGGADVWLALPA